MSAFYEEIYKVRSYEVDLFNRLKAASFFNYMQDIASVQAGKLGFGYEDLYKQDLYWVLSWVRLEILKYPAFEEDVKVKTWPKGFYKFYALRDVMFTDMKGEVCAKMTSAWILLRGEVKRPVDLRSLEIPIVYDSTISAVDKYPEKIKEPEGRKPDWLQKKKMGYSDIDINRHVNNSRYIEFINDAINAEGEERVVNLSVNFSSETKMGESLEIAVYKEKENDLIFIKNEASGKGVLQAMVEYR